MITLKGKYNYAKVFTEDLEDTAKSQIEELLNQEFIKNSIIRIMPDVHAGMGCVIGTTMTIDDKVVPNLVGLDIGCGIKAIKLKDRDIDFEKLDRVVRKTVPSGFNIRKRKHPFVEKTEIADLRCKDFVNMDRAILSIGTLGGGNHFIELGENNKGDYYLLVHTGSRHLGKQVAEYYQKKSGELINDINKERNKLKRELKKEKTKDEINEILKDYDEILDIPKNLRYIEGQILEDYLCDMNIVQEYANVNRKAIADVIVEEMGFIVEDSFTTIHNYIDLENMILRKGAVSAKKDEKLVIPFNMRDGAIICRGVGNKDWNYSAPHGAGRIMSRNEAYKNLSLEDFKKSMEGIYSSSVNQRILDEHPEAYKKMEEITKYIEPTVEIKEHIVPVYNYKSS